MYLVHRCLLHLGSHLPLILFLTQSSGDWRTMSSRTLDMTMLHAACLPQISYTRRFTIDRISPCGIKTTLLSKSSRMVLP